MTDVVIYQPAKNAMQSGRATTRKWVLEYDGGVDRRADSVMGWIGSSDTRGQVKMRFDSKDAAISFAERSKLSYRVVEPKARKLVKKNYADKFRWA